ncbi:MAG TPA: hypothetical protein DD727_05215 [Clostridiales bacterium]|nr:hypothetical protein [Clostridiales bacterium]
MNSRELVTATIKGRNTGMTPVYGWVSANLKDELTQAFGSVENFEDKYAFDMAHIFGGPNPFDGIKLRELRKQGVEITPEVLLDIPLMPADRTEDYENIRKALDHHQVQRQRFCYIQTPGIFECLNGAFGIENHLMYLALYPEALKEIYRRQAAWNARFAESALDLGMDMVHVSDDWGAQRSLMFSYDMWREMIFPYHQTIADRVKARGAFLSLHSDGYVVPALDGIVELGYDVLHPWQESAGMTYDLYLDRYQDQLAILGGLCIQTTIGFGDFRRLENEIRRVFSLLKGKRWMFCTTHFVQKHCSIEELTFAYDLAVKLARE